MLRWGLVESMCCGSSEACCYALKPAVRHPKSPRFLNPGGTLAWPTSPGILVKPACSFCWESEQPRFLIGLCGKETGSWNCLECREWCSEDATQKDILLKVRLTFLTFDFFRGSFCSCRARLPKAYADGGPGVVCLCC